MPAAKLYFQNEIATIEEHASGYVLLTYRAGPRQLVQVQTVLSHLATLLETRGWYRVLNLQQWMQAFTRRETATSAAFWHQRIEQWGHGLYVASVLAHGVFARIAATTMRQELQRAGLVYQLFDNEVQAGIWLCAQQAPPPARASGLVP